MPFGNHRTAESGPYTPASSPLPPAKDRLGCARPNRMACRRHQCELPRGTAGGTIMVGRGLWRGPDRTTRAGVPHGPGRGRTTTTRPPPPLCTPLSTHTPAETAGHSRRSKIELGNGSRRAAAALHLLTLAR
jgi:hypothetical protein